MKRRNTVISKTNKDDDIHKVCAFRCNTCAICSDYILDYYNNAAILTDFDKNIHFYKVIA